MYALLINVRGDSWGPTYFKVGFRILIRMTHQHTNAHIYWARDVGKRKGILVKNHP